MRRVVVESPYKGATDGDIARNVRYLRACMADCLARGDAPFASHGLYTQPGVLDDANDAERAIGISAGFAWRAVAEATVVYTDLGLSDGMKMGIADARLAGCHLEYRTLGGEWRVP